MKYMYNHIYQSRGGYMNSDRFEEAMPKFYGSVRVGERGQVVIPVEARKEFRFESGARLLVFGSSQKEALILTRAEFVTEFLSTAMTRLAQFEEMLRTNTEPPSQTD
jgi:bifunctional DNA-binding transcriptional regulator/antitoxin component of YhaV-PrlF toxin-antitoxin module